MRKLSRIGVDAVKFQIGIAEEHYSKDSLNQIIIKKILKMIKKLFFKQKKDYYN